MRKLLSFWILSTLFLTTAVAQTKKTKVACIGASITYGAFIDDREHNNYPIQLQDYLGENYEVRNFGKNGATLMRKGDRPYINNEQYRQSLAFQPDIMLIKLSANDTKPWNWKYKEEFMNDYQTLIDSYLHLDSHPRVILETPFPVRNFNSFPISLIIDYLTKIPKILRKPFPSG